MHRLRDVRDLHGAVKEDAVCCREVRELGVDFSAAGERRKAEIEGNGVKIYLALLEWMHNNSDVRFDQVPSISCPVVVVVVEGDLRVYRLTNSDFCPQKMR